MAERRIIHQNLRGLSDEEDRKSRANVFLERLRELAREREAKRAAETTADEEPEMTHEEFVEKQASRRIRERVAFMAIGALLGGIVVYFGFVKFRENELAPDPYAKYRDVQLRRWMPLHRIKREFGEPDSFSEWWNKHDNIGRHYSTCTSDGWSRECPYHVEKLSYGAFGAHSQSRGHITKHRLTLTFVNGDLYKWEKSTPIDRE